MGKFQQNKKRLFFWIIVCLLILLGTLQVNSSIQSQIFRIEGTGQKCEESWGTDIQIQSILLNGNQLKSKDVVLQGDWNETNGYFTATGADSDTWLEITFASKDDLEIVFAKQCGSGFIDLFKNGESAESLDLYAQEYTQYSYTGNRFDHAPLEQRMIPWVLLIEGLILTYFVVSAVLLVFWPQGAEKNKDILLLFVHAIVLYAAVELVNDNLMNVAHWYALRNILLYYALMLLVYVLYPQACLAGSIISVLCVGISIANYYVTLFRGTPLMPADFLIIQTAVTVMNQYNFRLTAHISAAFILIIIITATSQHFSKKRLSPMKTRAALIMIVLVLLIPNVTSAAAIPLDLWNIQGNIKHYGLGISLTANTCNMQPKKPKNYVPQEVEHLLDSYENNGAKFNPNIIVIMNEAFSDLSVLYDELDSNLYMPYFNSLRENTVKGTTMSSVFGGQTADSEYEFLTGNTMYYAKNNVPYQQFIYQDTYSLVRDLKDRGYSAVAVHPFGASGYNRTKVYPYLGFDNFLSIEDFTDCELVRSMYISDKDSYEKVIEVYEEIQETNCPAFIFNVTMQNHSAYDSGFFGSDVIRVPGMEGQYPDIEEYLTLVKYSDDALHVLFDYFSAVDEPTVILLFGDHQPKLDDDFYQTVMTSEDDLNQVQKKLEVPFLIWANYDIDEEQGLYTSMNYLSAILFDKTGIFCTPYQNYLLELRNSIPAINRKGYLGLDGSWYDAAESKEIEEKLEEYWTMQYYHMFEFEIS